ncbi:MAG: histidine phosphatase family protein [Microbacteriaceae bacterium]|nr:histidine phosphatase family protein [Burkholderiaceae bacterium]
MTLWVWRHPLAGDARGRCIGHTDLPVDPRRAKRLAHRIRTAARRHQLAHRVLTSPLQRCADVGRWLRRWGWQHTVVAALLEMDFGAWDGQAWADVPLAEVDAWCTDFLYHAPGGGENLFQVFKRVAAWSAPGGTDEAGRPTLIVGHAGWMLTRQWLASGKPWPTRAQEWPAAPRHSSLCKITA